MLGSTFGFVKLIASSGSHCIKWADEQHRPAGFESRLVPDLLLPFITTLIGLRAFDHVSSRVWWEAATNKKRVHTLWNAISFVQDLNSCRHVHFTTWNVYCNIYYLWEIDSIRLWFCLQDLRNCSEIAQSIVESLYWNVLVTPEKKSESRHLSKHVATAFWFLVSVGNVGQQWFSIEGILCFYEKQGSFGIREQTRDVWLK